MRISFFKTFVEVLLEECGNIARTIFAPASAAAVIGLLWDARECSGGTPSVRCDSPCVFMVCVRAKYLCLLECGNACYKNLGACFFLCVCILGCQWWLIFNHITEDKLAC